MALFPLNASILLEAQKKNVNKKIKIKPEDSEYDAMAEDEENEGNEITDDGVDSESSDEDNLDEDNDSSSDYTEMEDDSDSMSDDIDSEDDTSDATDYSDEENSDSDDTDYSDEENSDSDYSSSDESSDEESDIDKDIVNSDVEKNKLLMNDFMNLYYFSKTILEKLSNVDKGDIMVNSIITQVSKNITLLRHKLYEYIVNSFSDKYIHNLYQYNFFIQGMKINIEMLKKIKDFNVN